MQEVCSVPVSKYPGCFQGVCPALAYTCSRKSLQYRHLAALADINRIVEGCDQH